MLCLKGEELKKHIESETCDYWQNRDFVSNVLLYYKSNKKQVFGISGLRGTGKTVGLLQSIKGKNALFLCAEKGENQKAQDYINILKDTDCEIIVIDEYTWIPEKEELDAYLFTLVQNGKKVVITGTDSMSIDKLRYEELIHRIDIINVNNFSYNEYCRIFNLSHNKEICHQYLREGGLFKDYIINSFTSMQEYIKSSIINNLTSRMKNIDKEYAKAIVYTILYKAVCDSNVKSIPQFASNIPIEDFFDKLGIDSTIIINKHDFDEVSSVLRDAGVIVTVPNYRVRSDYRTYITNPAITYQMLLATSDNDRINDYMYGYIYEATCVSYAYFNLINDKITENKLYYIQGRKDGRECEIDFLILDEPRKKYAYLFECKLSDGPMVKESSSLVSSTVEKMLPDTEILGRYVIYNGQSNFDIINNKEILYIGTDSYLTHYYSVSANKHTILQNLKDKNMKSFIEEKQIKNNEISKSVPTEGRDDI